MTMATYARNTYDEPISTGGNREDLGNILWDVSPTDTPVLSMCGKTTATATNHEWLVDALESPAANAKLEGGDMVAVDIADRSRLGNYTQIMTKNATVSGTQEKVLKGGGIKSEMAYQLARRMKAIKNDGELAIVGVSNAKVGGDTTTAREMGSLDSYLTSNVSLAASGSSTPAGNGAIPSDYAGTDRALTETIFQASLQDVFDNGDSGDTLKCITTSSSKVVISGFTGADERHAMTDNKQLVNTIDVYVGDFQTVQIIADRKCKALLTYLISPEYLKIAEMRAAHSFDVARAGDATKKQIVWEWTLEVCNEAAHAVIGDLTT
jgi:hypothetical protein